MFAVKSLTEITLRALLIAIVVFNTIVPSVALAQSSQPTNVAASDELQLYVPDSTQNNYVQSQYKHSSPKTGEHTLTKSLFQTSSQLEIECYRGSWHPWTAWEYPCDPGDQSNEPWLWRGTIDNASESNATLLSPQIHFILSCPVYLTCAATSDVYYKVSVRYDSPANGDSMNLSAFRDVSSFPEQETGEQICGSGGQTGACTVELSGVLDDYSAYRNSFRFEINCFRGPYHLPCWSGQPTVSGITWDVQLSLEPILDDNATLSGCNIPSECQQSSQSNSQGIRFGPINTRTGGLFYQTEDISMPTASKELNFFRSYSSLATDLYSSTLGYGWTHNLDSRLIFSTDPGGEEGYVLFKAHTANQYRFADNGDGTYSPTAGVAGNLVFVSGEYVLTYPDQSVYTFDSTGKLITWTDSTGNTWNYTYNTSSLLVRVSADSGTRYLNINYNNGRIDVVEDHAERSISFEYDEVTGDLISMTDVMGEAWEYQYEDHRLTRVIDPLGHTIERTEYEDGRAVRQYDGFDTLIGELIYNSDGTTTITDALENVETHTYDGRHTLTGDEDGAGGTSNKTYDQNFHPQTVTDANENLTQLDWSADGANLRQIIDAAGNQTDITYNALNSPTSIIDPNEYETKYFYNNSNFPTLPTRIEYPLSFDNGATWIGTDYEYYSSGAAAGKVKFITDALGNQTFYTYTSSGQVETVTTAYGTSNTLTTTYAYDNLGRLVDMTDAQGIVTHNEYDDAGHLLKTAYNVHPTVITQNFEDTYNIVTEYTYDARGNQIAVKDTYGIITRAYYDLANRPVTIAQNLTGQTIETATPPARGTGITDENIRTDTEYDDAGNVIAITDPAGIVTRTYYDAANRPNLIIQNFTGTGVYNPAFPDENIRAEYFYDANGNLIATKDTLGIYTRTYYDELNRPETVVQNLTGQSYLDESPPARGSDTNIRADTEYDANGNVIATIDPRGITTRTYYDSLNRPITVVQNLGGQAISEPEPPTGGEIFNIRSDTYYDEAGNVIATVDPRGVATRTYYDSANRPYATVQNLIGQSIYVTTPPARGGILSDDNVRTDIAYDSFGRRDFTTDPMERVTKYQYDVLGRLDKVTANYVNGGWPQNNFNQQNIVTQYAYDALGRQVQVTDTLDRATVNEYDDLGRVVSVTQNYLNGQPPKYEDGLGNHFNLITSFDYDTLGNQIAVTDPSGSITRTYYDPLGRTTSVVQNLVGQGASISTPPDRANPPSAINNLRTDTIYLGNGNVNVVDELGETTAYGYDDLGRTTSLTDPLDHSTSFLYDANGNRVLMTDAEGVDTKYEYDNLNRLTAVIENYQAGIPVDFETNIRTGYTYDANENRLSILDGNSHATSFTYTAFGLLETETDPLGNTTTYGYWASGNRYSMLDANGETTYFGYDELNRLELVDYPGLEPNVTFGYDALNRRTSMTDGLGVTTWAYTNLDLPKSITDPFAAQVSYDYDELGNRTALTYPDASVVNYEYNAVNRLTEVNSDQLTVSSYQYDAAGRLKTISRANNVTTAYNYFDNGWLQDITHAAGIELLASYQYQYDNVGNRKQAIENVLSPILPPTATPTSPPTGTTTASATLSPTRTMTASFTPPPANTATATITQTPAQTSTPASYTLTLQPDAAAGSDTYMLSSSATTNYGASNELGVGEANIATNIVGRSLIKFDLSSIPSNATITSATLSLWTNTDYSNTTRTIRVYRLKVPFNETQATWNLRASGSNWQTAGASGTNDRESADIGSAQILSNESLNTEKQITLDSAKIQEILNGAFTNNGFLITADTELNDGFTYKSSDHATASQRPKLVIQYTVPSGGISPREGASRFLSNNSKPPQQSGFPTTSVLDNFNRANGAIGSNWTGQNSSSFTVSSNQLAINSSGLDSFAAWSPASFGADQEAYVTLTQITASGLEQGLLLKTAADASAALQVVYVASANVVRVLTYTSAQGWSQRGSDISVTFNNGDQLGARAKSNGDVEVYRNGSLLGTVSITAWAPYSGGGYIGLWYSNTSGGIVDDFGGGNVSASATPTFTATPAATNTPTITPTASNTPTITETPTVTLTPSDTPTPSNTPTITFTPSQTFTPSFTPTITNTPTLTPVFTSTPTSTPPPAGPVIFTYDYDPLYRLTNATYSDGHSFGYQYDSVGNVLQYTQNLGGSPVTTAYNYNNANQLTTAQMDNSPIVWEYAYDPNGRLTDILPDGNQVNGAKRYTYNAAGFLIQTKAHDGSGYQPQAEMLYDGLGQRLSMTGYALGTSVTTNYVLDPMQYSRPLTATSGGNSTVYFYGIDPIAEFTTDWSYSLPDGTNTPRQLTNSAGEITLSGRYTPWGDSLEYAGTGNFTFGYFGGLMDSATGLLYVGNGQYYDPATGRFLTRDVNPNSPNPYVPWGDPTGALLAPLALVGLIYGRKKKKSKFDYFVIMLFVAVGVGMGLSACAPANPPSTLPGSPQPPSVPPASPSIPNIPPPSQTPAPFVPPPVTPTPILDQIFATPCPTPVLTEFLIDSEFLKYRVNPNGQIASWKLEWKMATLDGVKSVASKFGLVMGLPPAVAFGNVFKEGLNLTMGLEGALYACALITAGGCTSSSSQINFVPNPNLAFLDAIENRTADMAYIANRNLVVHEIGHAFANKIPTRIDDPNNPDPTATIENPEHPANSVDSYKNQILLNERGWPVSPVSANLTWRQHPRSFDKGTFLPIEVFADMFLGWTFEEWGSDLKDREIVDARKSFMHENMSRWLETFK